MNYLLKCPCFLKKICLTLIPIKLDLKDFMWLTKILYGIIHIQGKSNRYLSVNIDVSIKYLVERRIFNFPFVHLNVHLYFSSSFSLDWYLNANNVDYNN